MTAEAAHGDAEEQVVTVGSVTFTDENRWLRENTPEVLAWQEQENAVTTAAIHGWKHFGEVRDQLDRTIADQPSTAEIWGTTTPRRMGRFWFRLDAVTADDPTLGLWVSETADGPRTLIVDPRDPAFGQDGTRAQLLWYEPAPDGSRVVFATYPLGETIGTLHVVGTEEGRLLPVTAPPHLAAGATPGWLPDGTGFYTADRTDAGEHRMRFVPVDPGVPGEADTVFTHTQLPHNTFTLTAQVSPDGAHVIALSGQHEQVACHLMDRATGEWRPFLPVDHPGECHGVWYDDDTYVAVVTAKAPRGRVVAIPVATSSDEGTWRELVPESEAVLRCVRKLGNDLVVCEIRDIAVEFRVITATGQAKASIPMPASGSSPTAMAARRFERSTELTFTHETFQQASADYHYLPGTNELVQLSESSRALPGLTVGRGFATSRDGTRIPYFLVHRADVDRTRPQPAFIEAYGGFNMALMPHYLGNVGPFLDAGGVYVQANLRGGAEYGREWYEAGRLTNKQNTFDDLFAVADDLIAAGVSEAGRLAFYGKSNGGMLAGVALVRRPDLWGAVVADVPLLDMLEFQSQGNPAARFARGAFLEDYGDVTDPDDSRRIAAYSPYHNIRLGLRHPAVLQIHGEHDHGCEPFHGRVFTARLRAASSANKPLLRVRKDYGHLPATRAQALEHHAEIVAFVMDHLGMTPAGSGS
ncbi:prolyl oligopeptidase family serine peptidase [Amycolatopsis suaedae]|uniref:prolyl oligopeptidase n=1 Tax=Amycolatopsis suaedae TaxID=2510978 RepID=A0A4Q7J9E9_9PSEU|nr:prolyl oligopeptidase family serine peptidase [Amycolatopsis suaedae]RZQ63847.1 S9 family peptidase [Amycolatopsis suaedae]